MEILNASPQKLVLLVDDDPMLRELFGEILGGLYAVKAVGSVVEAQHIIKSEHVDVVISDYHLDVQDGAELFAWVLQLNPALAARFILLTGDKDTDLSVFNPIATVLYKPVKIELLLKTVGQVCLTDKEMS